MFLTDILNSIPIVGHGKGLVHYLAGDREEGNRAMRESTRTTVVMSAGAVGSMAGPMGAAALASASGAMMDAVESIVTDTPTGVVAGVCNIIETASEGEMPIGGILQTTLSVGGDVVGGLGGSSIASSVSATLGRSSGTIAVKNVGKSIVESSGKAIIKSASIPAGETFGKSVARAAIKLAAQETTRTVIVQGTDTAVVCATTRYLTKETGEFLQQTSTSSSEPPPRSSTGQPPPSNPQQHQSSSPSSGGSGQQPPRQNPNNASESSHLAQTKSFWDELLALFGVQSLDEISIRSDVFMCSVFIFRGLKKKQKESLKKVIRMLKERNILRKTIETIVNIFNTVDLEDITFGNFLSLAEIILQYRGERAARINERRNSPNSYNQRRTEILRLVGTDFLPHDYTILRVFKTIKDKMELHTIPINFRNIFAAVHHYFKHRRVGEVEMSVEQYYDLIETNLEIIMQTTEYQELIMRNGRLVFERYYEVFGTRLLIALSRQGDRVYLRTCFFLDESNGSDKDGDMYINGRQL